ncbi:hypothetical protein [Vibrio diazotrophicus]|uniref:Uncharacterized protein n=1 Tax=Vibrio diazotrophicus TaxID=685 RepID=A0A329EBB4_VIBDI|nr:hypothetical protein [Vibrio diazotrophicus]RAS64233.1 hypothetical protein DET48_11014 [Vibrio diazotrophicus]
MAVDESKTEQGFDVQSPLDINYHQWTLRVAGQNPEKFELLYADKVLYQGKLELINNGEPLDVSEAQWKFRHRHDRIEQWCQLHHVDKLSVNMNYYFHDKAVVIEYLARNSIPTRLDIRHEIVPLDRVENDQPPQSEQPDWQRCRHGLPSESIRHSIKPDLFREAFSATQWIVLDKM